MQCSKLRALLDDPISAGQHHRRDGNPVAHQAAGRGERANIIDRGHTVAERQRELFDVGRDVHRLYGCN
jgi:hypothetical protein